MIAFLKKSAIAAAAVIAFSGVAVDQASAASFTFSNGGGNGTGTDVGPVGAFDYGLTLTSNNNGVGGIFTTYTNTAVGGAVNVSGQWNYSTNDVDGSYYDKFGYFIDNVFTLLVQLSTDGIPAPAFQNGAFSFNVGGGHSYGFYMLATDGILGAATGSAYVNVASIPVPAGGLLLISALGGVAALRRRKSV